MFVTNPIGIVGEDTAADLLRKQGFKILERNWRLGHFEVDIIAKDNHTIVFAEVKARTTTFGDISPEEYVDEGKKRRMTVAANAYVRLHRIDDLQPRFDIIGVVVNPATHEVVERHHLPGVFSPRTRTITSSAHLPSWRWKMKKKNL
ncbi:MAG: YraN family protein [Paludibacteraceae bacterium]|nr:YraN family protein [Paludibacteraceae bacterium]MBQ2607889.1 YraN family protein [Paludibacteraceae bacterium]